MQQGAGGARVGDDLWYSTMRSPPLPLLRAHTCDSRLLRAHTDDSRLLRAHTQRKQNPHSQKNHELCDPRCAQAVVWRSITLNNSYITIAITPTTTRPANANPICMAEPAEISR